MELKEGMKVRLLRTRHWPAVGYCIVGPGANYESSAVPAGVTGTIYLHEYLGEPQLRMWAINLDGIQSEHGEFVCGIQYEHNAEMPDWLEYIGAEDAYLDMIQAQGE